MASPALLLLMLMMMSSLILQPSSADGIKKEEEEPAVIAFKFVLDNPEIITDWLSTIPYVGVPFAAVLKAFVGSSDHRMLMQETENIQTEITKLKVCIISQHAKDKYGTIELSIITAWKKFEKLIEYVAADHIEDAVIKQHFKDYRKSGAADKLSELSTLIKGTAFIQSIYETMCEDFRCDEKKISVVKAYVDQLMYKSYLLNVLLYNYERNDMSQKNIVTALHYFYDGIMELHKSLLQKCFDKDTKYIELDLKDQIIEQKKTTPKKMVVAIRKFLSEKYFRYDWMLVLYNKNIWGTINQHKLSEEFIVIDQSKLKVAAARQIKGKHTQAKDIREKIKTCLGTKPECESLSKKFRGCDSLDKHFTIFHQYRFMSDSDYEGKKGLNQDLEQFQPQTGDEIVPIVDVLDNFEESYVYKGKCYNLKYFWSYFTVMIKSDEEILNADPCDPSPCVNGGLCKALFAGVVCECVFPYHGSNCGKELKYTFEAPPNPQGLLALTVL